jgi:acid phosphatase type 7
VGTGGANHTKFEAALPTSEVRDDRTFGVLQMTLRPTGYEWEFVPEEGSSFTDRGSDQCHEAPA